MIDGQALALRAREHLLESGESVLFTTERLFALIPSALAEWVLRTGNDPQKRLNFLRETEEITITDGVAAVSDALEDAGIQGQFIDQSEISIEYNGDDGYPANPQLPLQFVNSKGRLTMGGIQDRHFVMCFFDGKRMEFRNPEDGELDTLTGTFTIRAVSVPKTLTDIPASVEGELASILAEIARKYNVEGESKGVAVDMQMLG